MRTEVAPHVRFVVSVHQPLSNGAILPFPARPVNSWGRALFLHTEDQPKY